MTYVAGYESVLSRPADWTDLRDQVVAYMVAQIRMVSAALGEIPEVDLGEWVDMTSVCRFLVRGEEVYRVSCDASQLLVDDCVITVDGRWLPYGLRAAGFGDAALAVEEADRRAAEAAS